MTPSPHSLRVIHSRPRRRRTTTSRRSPPTSTHQSRRWPPGPAPIARCTRGPTSRHDSAKPGAKHFDPAPTAPSSISCCSTNRGTSSCPTSPSRRTGGTDHSIPSRRYRPCGKRPPACTTSSSPSTKAKATRSASRTVSRSSPRSRDPFEELALARVVAVHGYFDTVAQDHLHRVGRFLDRDRHLLAGALAEPAEDVVGALLLRGGLAHAEPHAEEGVVVQVLLDGAQPVVAGQSPADLHPQHRGLEVELVVDDHEVLGRDAVAAHQR